ncbi:MAG: ankyrin repeat domain-containing protein, partial [Acidiferrobacterales bacterium]
GADVNARDKDGATPLHPGVVNGHKAVVELLIAKGADINARTKAELTPLRAADLAGREEIAALLKRHGATEELSI